jgi:asparagine synthase (glutamine-hydrolysing)
VPQMLKASRWLAPTRPILRSLGAALPNEKLSPRSRRLMHFLQRPPSTASAYWTMRGVFNPVEIDALLPRYGFDARSGSEVGGFDVPSQPTPEDEVSYLEMTRYMRNQLLRDSDVMSMAWGLELRVPFADSVLVDAVSNIPSDLRLARGKQLLLDAIPEIPDWVRERAKQGFTFPFKSWMLGEWRDVFRRIEAETPVSLNSWSRSWCLLALDNFVQKHGLTPKGA